MRTVLKSLAALSERASESVRISGELTGSAADTWRGLYEASEGLNLDDSRMVVLLMVKGAATAERVLLDLPREA
jgi:hypothetical protein